MNATINGRTPEEIKKGLECCRKLLGVFDPRICRECPHYSSPNCRVLLFKDVCSLNQKYEDHIRDLTKKVEQLERERDAAVEDEIPPTSILREFVGGNTFYRKEPEEA